MRTLLLIAATTLLLGLVHAADCDFSAVDARAQQLMSDSNLADGGVAIGTARGVLHKRYFGGNYGDTTVVPLASASKLLAGVRIMQLVRNGAIDFDTPVSTYLPEFSGVKGSMTMRQMFSHTAGYGDDLDALILGADLTLAQAVAWIACCIDQPYPPPGAYFAYGGISMQVGGEVAEVRSGEDWQAGWIAHLGVPLGITSIDWQGLGTTANYRISGGAQASLPDYAKLLGMLAGGGVGNGRRVLGPPEIATIQQDQTRGAVLAYSPPGADGSTSYGVGAWVEQLPAPSEGPLISSIGKYGYAPWVDFGHGVWGILMIDQEQATIPTMGDRSHAALLDIVALLRAMAVTDCALQETWDEVFRDGLDAPM